MHIHCLQTAKNFHPEKRNIVPMYCCFYLCDREEMVCLFNLNWYLRNLEQEAGKPHCALSLNTSE